MACLISTHHPIKQVRSLVTTDGRYRYPQTPVFLDLVPAEDRSVELGSISIKPAQDLFRSPLTSFLYERGWRVRALCTVSRLWHARPFTHSIPTHLKSRKSPQISISSKDNFKLSGFPGIDAEFTDLMAFLQPVQPASATVLDLSCGSGLMTRRLVQKGGWARVIAADYSESMLRETKGRFLRERIAVPTLVRADVARLPFRTGSLDAVHAGAYVLCAFASEVSYVDLSSNSEEKKPKCMGCPVRPAHIDPPPVKQAPPCTAGPGWRKGCGRCIACSSQGGGSTPRRSR